MSIYLSNAIGKRLNSIVLKQRWESFKQYGKLAESTRRYWGEIGRCN